MRDQLIQYVELLFAAAPNAGDIKQEILQNTLDRYDDLIAQGKSPEAAYRLAISGIGDINEILEGSIPTAAATSYQAAVKDAVHEEAQDIRRRKLRAVAIALYISSAIPLIGYGESGHATFGLCFTLLLVAAATALIIMSGKNEDDDEPVSAEDNSPQAELKKSIGNVISAATLAVYLIVSFATQAWLITWLIFPIGGSIRGLVNAILDLKEVMNHEN